MGFFGGGDCLVLFCFCCVTGPTPKLLLLGHVSCAFVFKQYVLFSGFTKVKLTSFLDLLKPKCQVLTDEQGCMLTFIIL